MNPLYIYKIKDINTNLFSTGGINPSWTKYGKSWKNINHLKRYLRLFFDYDDINSNIYKNNIPENWEIIKIEYNKIKEDNIKAKDMIS